MDLTPDELQQTVQACQRLLINEHTKLTDLRAALVERLADRSPLIAAKIAALGESEMAALRRALLKERCQGLCSP